MMVQRLYGLLHGLLSVFEKKKKKKDGRLMTGDGSVI